MIRSLGRALSILAGAPGVVLPALAAVLVGMGLLVLALEPVLGFAYNVFVLGIAPEATLLELPFKLLVMYPFEILGLALFAAVSFALNAWLALVYANYAMGREKAAKAGRGLGIAAAVRAASSRAGDVAAYTAFVACAAVLYFAIAGMLIAIATAVPLLGLVAIVLLIAQLLLGVYIVVRLYFTPVVMAVENLNVKKALKQCWDWSGKRSAEVFALIIVFVLLGYALSGIGYAFFDLIPEDDLVPALIFAVFASVAVAYNNLAAAVYYRRKVSS